MNYAIVVTLFLLSLCLGGRSALAESTPKDAGAMNNQRLGAIIHRLDGQVQGKPGFWRFSIEGKTITVITDEKADRMRILVPVVKANALKEGELYRLMQANFDTSLDARYAVAKGILWSAFIHPLGILSKREFLSGLGQTVNLVLSFRNGYSSGALVFRGGDSEGLRRRELIDRLIEEGSVI